MARQPSTAQRQIVNDLRNSFKRIENYTDEELAAVIAVYGADLPHAFQYLNFIDSYFEQRKRKHASEAAK